MNHTNFLEILLRLYEINQCCIFAEKWESVRNTEGILTDGKTEMNAGEGEKQPLTQAAESAWRTFKTGQE